VLADVVVVAPGVESVADVVVVSVVGGVLVIPNASVDVAELVDVGVCVVLDVTGLPSLSAQAGTE
jgi:hypothetical protein